MPTNLVAVAVTILAINWTTVSRTIPVVPAEAQSYAVARLDTLNQVGIVVTNYVARIAWKGRTNEFVLETVNAVDKEPQTRSVFENPWARTFIP